MGKYILVLGIILSSFAQAGSDLPFSKKYIETIKSEFIAEGKLSEQKFLSYKKSIQKRRDQLFELSYNDRVHRKGQSKKKAKKKALDDVANYDLLLDYADLAKTLNNKELYLHLDKVKTFDEALKVEGNLLGYKEVFEGIRGVLKKYSIKKLNPNESQAVNLKKTQEQFFEVTELKDVSDISKLGPNEESAFVFDREDISEVDVLDSYLNGKNPLYEGMDVWWPSENNFTLIKIRKTQSKPKLDVTYVNPKTGKEEIFKIKLAKEIHSEPTAGALANTLGIYTDLSKNLRDIKIHLGETSFIEFRNDWNSYYGDFELEKLIKEKGEDEKGNYIVFYDGLIEQKFKEEDSYKRIGPWAWNAENHKHMREVRGLLIFAVWIANTDLKESENNKLIMRETPSGPRFFKVMQDMGLSLGNLLGEKPLDFDWNPIKEIKDDEIVLRFKNIQDNSGLNNVTVADARWMIRKIAKLTRKQIRDAVSIGGWPNEEPYDLESVLVEKLISRRNALVRAFGLDNEFPQLEFKRIELKNVPSKIGEFTTDFSNQWIDLTRGPLKRIPHVVVDLMRAGIGAISKIELDPVEIGLDDGHISQILFKLNRKIVKNPNPRNEAESFIIQDKFLFGFRYGYGVVLSGDVAKYREYNLIHTARTKDEAKYKGNFFLNLTLPAQVFLKRLPKNHILTVGDYLETRGRVKIEAETGISLGTEGSLSRIYLGRSIVAKDQDSLILYEDNSKYNKAAWRLFTKIGLIKIPFSSVDSSKGKLSRNIYELNEADLNIAKVQKAVKAVLEDLDHSEIKKLAKPRVISSEFIEKNFKINLLGFVGRKKYSRSDDIVDLGYSESKEDDRYFFQLEKSNDFFWNSFLSKESFSESAQVIIEENHEEETIDSALKLDYLHSDQRVTSKELKEVYLPFLNSVTKEKLLDFSPFAHSSNNEWGKMNLRLKMEIYDSGLKKVLKTNKSQLLSIASKMMGSQDGLKFNFRGKAYSKRKFKRDIERFSKKIAEIKSKGLTKKEAAETILTSFYKNVRLRDGAYSALVLQTITSLLENKDYYVEASFYPEENGENKLPERVVPFNIEGQRKDISSISFLSDLEDTLHLYEYFVSP